MYAAERRREILKRLSERQSIETQLLADTLGVSSMTIRRDIKLLEQEGFIRQTYGGATVQVTKSIELSFNSRTFEHAEQKRRIGAHAASLIQPGQTVFLGPGTTTAHVAQFLPPHPHLLVVTASLSHASLLRSRHIRVVVIGGVLAPDELYMTGTLAQDTVAQFQADVCVIGVSGMDAGTGLSEMDLELAALHRLMLARSARTLVLADHSKFGHRAPAIVSPISAVNLLITDRIPATERPAIERHGTVVTALDDLGTGAGAALPQRSGERA